MEHQRKGGKGRMIFKINHLVDKPMIRLLYQASQAGVKIDLVVRGMCGLKPGIPGSARTSAWSAWSGASSSTRASTTSATAAMKRSFMGSADLMPRNLNQRVEVLFEVEDPQTCATCAMKSWPLTCAITSKPPDAAGRRYLQPAG
jgi:polyphosphate kinase